jgi:hypothetical protein
MKSVYVGVCALLAVSFTGAGAENPDSGGVPAHLVVTAEGKNLPTIQAADVMVHQGSTRTTVRDWVPLQGDKAGLQLTIMIDDGADTNLGSQLGDLKKFIGGLPSSTEVAVGYMHNGTVGMTQTWTSDHTKAAGSLRLPTSIRGIDASPYIALSDLIKKWPQTDKRREVLMITDGVDLLGGPPPQDPYLDEAIHDAQKAGVIVFSIYFRGEGHFGHSYWRINWGQNYLSQLSEETGGEAYWQGFGNPVSFAPYLDDLTEKLDHQYLLTMVAKPGKKPGLEPVKLRTELHKVELLSADKVYVVPQP